MLEHIAEIPIFNTTYINYTTPGILEGIWNETWAVDSQRQACVFCCMDDLPILTYNLDFDYKAPPVQISACKWCFEMQFLGLHIDTWNTHITPRPRPKRRTTNPIEAVIDLIMWLWRRVFSHMDRQTIIRLVILVSFVLVFPIIMAVF